MKTQLRAISPVIATVIILAVTIAIAIAVVGWITGLFGATTKGTPNLQLLADNYLYSICKSGTNNYTVVVLHLKNIGTATANIYKIEVQGVGSFTMFKENDTFNPSGISNSVGSDGSNVVQLKPGEEKYIIAWNTTTLTEVPTPGTWYNVFVYTKESGAPISVTITAEACPSTS